MKYSYIYPSALPVPQGYYCSIEVPVNSIASRLISKDCKVVYKLSYFIDGKNVKTTEFILHFVNFKNINNRDNVFNVHALKISKKAYLVGFIEATVESLNGDYIFHTRKAFGNYATFYKDNSKSFFVNFSYKVGDPQIIAQMATFKRYVIAYPVCNISLENNYSNTLLLVNPYYKPIVVSFKTSDGRSLPRQKVLPFEGVYYPLSKVLIGDESNWRGSIQLTAKNRLLTYIINHRCDDIENISDLEHLDPFRSDPTHIRALQKIRILVGEYFKNTL
jgi:hypothetical protein